MNKIEKAIEDFSHVEIVNEKGKVVFVASMGQKELLKAVIEEIEDTFMKDNYYCECVGKCTCNEPKIINLIKESIK